MGMVFFSLAFVFAVIGVMVFCGIADGKYNGSTRNYQMRFEPTNNKYYIVNVVGTREYTVQTTLGFRIFYDDQVQADLVIQRLNRSETK